jgi:acyl carrier protein
MTMLKNLEEFLLAEIAADSGKQTLSPDEDLLEQRIIDSMGILKLVVFIEKTHGIKIVDEDIVPENFQTLNNIVKFIEQKKQSN